MSGQLVYLDTETTGLDYNKHDAFEVAWAVEDGPIRSLVLPHTLANAEPDALRINHYLERKIDKQIVAGFEDYCELADTLRGNHLVGSNPSFDERWLTKKFRAQHGSSWQPVWHHRKVDLASFAMGILHLPKPPGMADVVQHLQYAGVKLPAPDHTAAGDVHVLRQAFAALFDMQAVTMSNA